MSTSLMHKKELTSASVTTRCQASGSYFLAKLTTKEISFYQGTARELQLLERIQNRDSSKTNRKQWSAIKLRKIHEQLSRYLNNENVPLVVMGNRSLKSAFIKASSYPFIRDDALDENFSTLSETMMRHRANKISSDLGRVQGIDAVSNFEQSKVSGRTLTTIEEISIAAANGRVHQLFVEKGRKFMAFVDLTSGQIFYSCSQGRPKRINAIEKIKRWVVEFRGEVYPMPREKIPGSGFICAVVRW